MDNYPDDIRMYDHDPRSPFYSGPDYVLCDRCYEAFEDRDIIEDDGCFCGACHEEVLDERRE
jgi:hypothetical protein